MILGVIPARGGSKSIPRKNLALVFGRPLIDWTIDAARRSRVVDRIVVSTDDHEIAEAARAAGAEVPVLRPVDLAHDSTPGIEPVIHMVEALERLDGYRPAFVMILQPTSPLRTAEDIRAAVTLLDERHGDALISVTRLQHPLSWTSPLSPDGVLTEFRPDVAEETDRQAAAVRYAQNGAIYIVRRELLIERRTLYGDRTLAYVMPAERSLDVDEPWQLEQATAQLAATPRRTLRIGNRDVGGAAPCFVIAEVGVNHNGNAELAERLVDAAAAAGADAVKLQTWDTDRLVTAKAPLAEYQKRGDAAATQYEMLKALELPTDVLRSLKRHAEHRGLELFSSPDDEGSADVLEQIGVGVFKIGSGELTNPMLLRHVALKRRPMIVSTGMATMSEVAAAVRAVEDAGNSDLALLHCVSKYPSHVEDMNLRAMDTLAAFGYPVGLSDYTPGIDVSVAAVARGAAIVEKHLTLDRSLPGPDHRSSLEPEEFASLVCAVRDSERMLGDGIKRPVAAELAMRTIVRRVIVAARAMRSGEVVGEADVELLRAGSGVPPTELSRVLGRRLRRDVARHDPITLDIL